MEILQSYISRQKELYSVCLDQTEKSASIFVVIPCYNEPELIATLDSLANCSPPRAQISVMVVINDATETPEEAVNQNILTLISVSQWQNDHPDLFFDVIRVYAHALPQKWAGVGWARKIGMDEAVKQMIKNSYSDGIIISLDADSVVLPNYLQAIETAFDEHPQFNFFTIHFEHPIDTHDLSPTIKEGIIRYELHMRYYRNAMEWSGYPHAIHTVGSSFALKGSAYAKHGGMNRRKAGEDFYFLHKMVLLGPYGNISKTTVLPASRCSDRVPFGTGAALKKWSEGGSELNYTYSLEAFRHLQPLFAVPSQFWEMKTADISTEFNQLHPLLSSFCENSKIVAEIIELKNNCSNSKVFAKRFFHLFNAFWILQYLNSAHHTTLNRASLLTESVLFLQEIGIPVDCDTKPEYLLKIFREIDKKKEGC